MIQAIRSPDDDSNVSSQRAIQQAQIKRTRAAVDWAEPVTDIVAPIMTIINTRSAHGVLGMDELRSALRSAICGVHAIKIRVWPQFLGNSEGPRAVSMSWWLSSPVQRHLHQQTEGKTNGNENEDRLKAVWEVMKTTSSSCGKS